MQEVKKIVCKTKSSAETESVAEAFAKSLKPGSIVLLSGDLGAGKTVFTKGFVRGSGVKNADVVSPTFTIMNDYGGKVNHFDLYRLNSVDEFESTGAFEQLYGDAISVVEWPEIVGFSYFPKTAYVVEIKKVGETEREIVIRGND